MNTLAKREPVALVAAIAVIVVSVLAAFGIGVETELVETLILDAIIVIGAFVQRSQVTPAKPAIDDQRTRR